MNGEKWQPLLGSLRGDIAATILLGCVVTSGVKCRTLRRRCQNSCREFAQTLRQIDSRQISSLSERARTIVAAAGSYVLGATYPKLKA